MFWKIFAFIIPVSMAIAFFLSLNGVTYIDTGVEMYAFFKTLSINFEKFRYYEIPKFTMLSQVGVGILDQLIGFANLFISIGNFFVLIINAIITILEFILAFITTTGQFIDTLIKAYAPSIP